MSPAAQPRAPESRDDVCEVEVFTAPGAPSDAPPDLLVEVPHGATQRRHFDATRRHLVGDYPEDLEQYFFVNTDVGSIECARWVARMVTGPARFPELDESIDVATGSGARALKRVLLLRGLVARAFIDCNRVISAGSARTAPAGMTPGLPAYVREPEDVRTLTAMHAAYQAAATRAYSAVCGAGGRALLLHTYAPRSIVIEAFDEGIVAALRRAYEPENYESWERRPAVDLITESLDGRHLAPEGLVASLRDRYAKIGVATAENATYRLHDDTMGYVHSAAYPGSVLCMEINRELLAEPFTPFAEMSISETKARRMAAPLAASLLADSAAL